MRNRVFSRIIKNIIIIIVIGSMVGCGNTDDTNITESSSIVNEEEETVTSTEISTDALEDADYEIYQVNEAFKDSKRTSLEEAELHNVVQFGSREGRPLEWVVLKVDGNGNDKKLLLMLNSYIENENFFMNEDDSEDYKIWENSYERAYLNNNFYENTFSEEEKSHIMTSEIRNYEVLENDRFSELPKTKDKIFTLSASEYAILFKVDTWYDNALYAYSEEGTWYDADGKKTYYFLRNTTPKNTLGYVDECVWAVRSDGCVGPFKVLTKISPRPAVWVMTYGTTSEQEYIFDIDNNAPEMNLVNYNSGDETSQSESFETKESTESDSDTYEIPDVVKSLEKAEYGYHIGADNLFYVYSQSKILDKGDYYEVPDAVFVFFDSTNTDPEEDYPTTEKGFKPVNLRIRKGSKVLTDNYDYADSSGKYDEYKQYETDTEDLFSKDGKLINPYIGRDGSTFSCSDLIFDEEGYVTYFASLVGD